MKRTGKEWLKLPGLFLRHEFEQVVVVDGEHEYLFEPAGHDEKGRELIAIYCLDRRAGSAAAPIDLCRQGLSASLRRASRDGGVS